MLPPVFDADAVERFASLFSFSWRDDAGRSWTIAPRPQGSSPVTLRFAGPVCCEGRAVGGVRRNVVHGERGVHVRHVNLTIDDHFKASGFGTALWNDALGRYAAAGIDVIEILADHEGKTFWARDPVRFDVADRPRQMLAGWGGATAGDGCGLFLSAASEATPSVKDAEELVRQIQTDPAAVTPAGLFASRAGRLLLSGASWQGRVELQAG